jgi:hypothetical protein
MPTACPWDRYVARYAWEQQSAGELKADATDDAGDRPGQRLRAIDLVRQYMPAYVDRYADQAVPQVQSVLAKSAPCQTAALGGHAYECPQGQKEERRRKKKTHLACSICTCQGQSP